MNQFRNNVVMRNENMILFGLNPMSSTHLCYDVSLSGAIPGKGSWTPLARDLIRKQIVVSLIKHLSCSCSYRGPLMVSLH